jgi:transcription antitermination factor NusG
MKRGYGQFPSGAEINNMASLWYAVRSKPNKEDFLASQLQAGGFVIYYPRLRVSIVNPRARKIRPYFPGYLFVHADLQTTNLSDLKWMPGGTGLVSYGGEPAVVPDSLITAIQRRVEELNASTKPIVADLNPGDPVILKAGPFAGYEAIFDGRISGQDRVRVLLNFLQRRQVPIEVESQLIGRVKRK